MKEKDPCPFAMKMIRDKFGIEEILAHMKECPNCQKISNKLVSGIKQDLGIDLNKPDTS